MSHYCRPSFGLTLLRTSAAMAVLGAAQPRRPPSLAREHTSKWHWCLCEGGLVAIGGHGGLAAYSICAGMIALGRPSQHFT